MRKLQFIKGVVGVAAGLVMAVSAQAADITGAGATFPYPIYSKWAEAYKAATGIGLNYQSIGSGGGVKQIKAKTVDFGASDRPLPLEELEKEGLMQFPAIIGGVVPVMNLDGVAPGQMKLTADIIAGIHLGKISKWNDPAIVALNPDLKLPALAITVVHRADGSGTTFLWTDYLSKANASSNLLWAQTLRSNGLPVWVAKVTRASPPMFSASKVHSATLSMLTPKRTRSPTRN